MLVLLIEDAAGQDNSKSLQQGPKFLHLMRRLWAMSRDDVSHSIFQRHSDETFDKTVSPVMASPITVSPTTSAAQPTTPPATQTPATTLPLTTAQPVSKLPAADLTASPSTILNEVTASPTSSLQPAVSETPVPVPSINSGTASPSISVANTTTVPSVTPATATSAPTAAKNYTFAPSVATTGNTTFAPSRATIGNNTLAPSVVTMGNGTLAPSVTTTGNTTLAPSVATTGNSTLAPTVFSTANVTLAPTPMETLKQYLERTLTITGEIDAAGSPQNEAFVKIESTYPDLLPDAPETRTRIAQMYGLNTMYYALNGPDWKLRDDWASDVDFCGDSAWYGVECNDDQIVLRLNLTENDLMGNLPSEIKGLSGLSKYVSIKMVSDLRLCNSIVAAGKQSNHWRIAKHYWGYGRLAATGLQQQLYQWHLTCYHWELGSIDITEIELKWSQWDDANRDWSTP